MDLDVNLQDLWMSVYDNIHDDVYSYKIVKPVPSEWIEETIYLTKDVSRFSGFFKYAMSPYTREVVDRFNPADPTRVVAVMKCAQSGFTQGVIIPAMWYIISENPDSMLFMAGDKQLAANSIRTRFDPVGQSSGLSSLIRPNVIRKKNQRTGDTDYSKEYAGGNLVIEGTQNADKMRQFSVKTVFADDWEAAPRADKKEGSTRKLIEGRQTSFGNLAKTLYCSTPAIQQTSNIEPVYLLGDQRKWHWKCPKCKTRIPVEWRTPMLDEDDNSFGGIQYELTDSGRLIKDSVHYKAQCCGHKIKETQKYELNLKGKWIPTAEPVIAFYVSYYMNALIIPPGFITWVDLVNEWIEANPKNGKTDPDKLKTFMNIRLGQTWVEMGETPKVNKLMQNTSEYKPGIVPDETCYNDGNKEIVFLSLACDLNGVMQDGNEDVRLDWEVVAHTSTGVTYSVDHGSIGTFKRKRDRTRTERDKYGDRKKWTYMHGVPNSVWPEFTKIIQKEWKFESGGVRKVDITVIDTGFFTRLAKDYIESFEFEPEIVVGVKGNTEIDYRRVNKDTPRVKRSREDHSIYILEVNQVKDELSSFIKLRVGADGYQPEGFMNFPQSRDGKYQMKSYFVHYEGEKRTEVIKNEQVVGFRWEKKNSQSLNHFWDVRIYNIAAKDIYLDLLRRSDPRKLGNITWAEFCYMITNG
jgi:phage terminase large subunit GpA-like protein